MRRGEVLGLPWSAIDMVKGTIEVVQTVSEVNNAVVLGPPKTERSRRTIKVPPAVIVELERHRKEQLEARLKLGLGGRPELIFTDPVGAPLDPEKFSDTFSRAVRSIKPITFHCLRHTHITLLLKSGVRVHVVSARAGHAQPSITLNTYCHLLGGEDNDAARQAEAILGRVLR
jgi:integrase